MRLSPYAVRVGVAGGARGRVEPLCGDERTTGRQGCARARRTVDGGRAWSLGSAGSGREAGSGVAPPPSGCRATRGGRAGVGLAAMWDQRAFAVIPF